MEQGGFAATVCSQDGPALTAADVQIQIMTDLFVGDGDRKTLDDEYFH